MLSDVVTPSSYLTFNVTIAQVLGLVNAVYCAELLDVYSKARRKKKLDEDNYFIVDRDFVKVKTSITVDEQYLCDASLSEINLVTTSPENPNKIKFDVEQFMRIIAEDDSKKLTAIYKKINLTKNQTEAKRLKKSAIKENLKRSIKDDNIQIYNALVDWLDTLFDEKFIKEKTIEDFQTLLYNYCKTDVDKALKIISIAKSQGWTSCVWAIKSYEDEQKILAQNKQMRTTQFKVATQDKLSKKKY